MADVWEWCFDCWCWPHAYAWPIVGVGDWRVDGRGPCHMYPRTILGDALLLCQLRQSLSALSLTNVYVCTWSIFGLMYPTHTRASSHSLASAGLRQVLQTKIIQWLGFFTLVLYIIMLGHCIALGTHVYIRWSGSCTLISWEHCYIRF